MEQRFFFRIRMKVSRFSPKQYIGRKEQSGDYTDRKSLELPGQHIMPKQGDKHQNHYKQGGQYSSRAALIEFNNRELL